MKKTVHSEQSVKLCELLIAARKKAGLTQQKLAELLEKPQSFVAKYELGERRLDVIEFVTIAQLLEANATKMLKILMK